MKSYQVEAIFRDSRGRTLFRRDPLWAGDCPDARQALTHAHAAATALAQQDPRVDMVASTVRGPEGERVSSTDYVDELVAGLASTGLFQEVDRGLLDRTRPLDVGLPEKHDWASLKDCTPSEGCPVADERIIADADGEILGNLLCEAGTCKECDEERASWPADEEDPLADPDDAHTPGGLECDLCERPNCPCPCSTCRWTQGDVPQAAPTGPAPILQGQVATPRATASVRHYLGPVAGPVSEAFHELAKQGAFGKLVTLTPDQAQQLTDELRDMLSVPPDTLLVSEGYMYGIPFDTEGHP